jgi:hypothetical protein
MRGAKSRKWFEERAVEAIARVTEQSVFDDGEWKGKAKQMPAG